MLDALLVLAGLVVTAGLALLLVEAGDEHLETRYPGYTAAWARVFGEDQPPLPSNVRALAPDACSFCGSNGWHREGCSYLDRLDALWRSAATFCPDLTDQPRAVASAVQAGALAEVAGEGATARATDHTALIPGGRAAHPPRPGHPSTPHRKETPR